MLKTDKVKAALDLIKQQDELASKSKVFGKILWFERGSFTEPCKLMEITNRPMSMTRHALDLWEEGYASTNNVVEEYEAEIKKSRFYAEALGEVAATITS